MTWNDITVQQFQEIYRLSLNTDLEEMEKIERIICICYDKTENEVDEMPMLEFTTLAKQCSFLLTDKIPGKCVRSFRIGTKKYAINYNPAKLRHRQYVEILHFSDKPVENMHYIMASLVRPVKFGFKQKNMAEMHESIALDMLNAPVIHVYHSCVFFCKLFLNLMQDIRGYLEQEMMKKGIEKSEATKLLNDSHTAMAGFIQQAR